jgi:RND family efflux transporter MFP subunit
MNSSQRRIVAPIAILALGIAAVVAIFATRKPVVPRPPDVPRPLIRAVTVAPQRVQLVVRASGTVTPSTESELVPQVSGEVVWVSPAFVPGGFFEHGEPLVRIDPADYAVALESARAAVAAAESDFARARKERKRQRQLADRSVSSQSRIDDAENAYRMANARLREARSQLERAERDVERTEILAPYDGRVRSETVDVGQFVSRGNTIAKLYAVDFAEVRLPLPDRELAYLDLALDYRDRRDAPALPLAAAMTEDTAAVSEAPIAGEDREVERASAPAGSEDPVVVLEAEFAGATYQWEGRIVRTEGEIDPKSRMVHVVARIPDPYGRSSDTGRPPLAVGLFVDAEIMGRVIEDAFVIPRAALRDWQGSEVDQVLVVDAESRLRFRDVEVLRAERDRVIVTGGLSAGEQVCISPMRAVTDGMFVEVARDDESAAESLVGAGS